MAKVVFANGVEFPVKEDTSSATYFYAVAQTVEAFEPLGTALTMPNAIATVRIVNTEGDTVDTLYHARLIDPEQIYELNEEWTEAEQIFTTETQTRQRPTYTTEIQTREREQIDPETGEVVVDENGDPVMETYEEEVEVPVVDENGDPVMEDYQVEVEVPVLDENGDPTYTTPEFIDYTALVQLRAKSETELRIEALEASQEIQDGAITDLADVIAEL